MLQVAGFPTVLPDRMLPRHLTTPLNTVPESFWAALLMLLRHAAASGLMLEALVIDP